MANEHVDSSGRVRPATDKTPLKTRLETVREGVPVVIKQEGNKPEEVIPRESEKALADIERRREGRRG